MDWEYLKSKAMLYSRVKPAQPREEFFQFTPEEFEQFVESIVKECAYVADANHENIKQYGEALAGVMLENTGDLIRRQFGIKDN